MNQRRSVSTSEAALAKKAPELARNLLSALFMAVRTAQIHDPANRAYESAISGVLRAAELLFAATGGFSVQFVEESVFLNGSRLRFDASAWQSMRSLRNLLESKGMGGLEMRVPPTFPAVRALVQLFSPQLREDNEARAALATQIGLLGLQRYGDSQRPLAIDRRVFAVQCYGKLVLAVREQRERWLVARDAEWEGAGAPVRLRIARVVQDLVELASDRPDFLLRLQSNTQGAEPAELFGANSCALAIALGAALGVKRSDLVDLGIGALFCRFAGPDLTDPKGWVPSLAGLMREQGEGPAADLRAAIVAEQAGAPRGARPHVYSRIVSLAARYQELTLTTRQHPLDILANLYNEARGGDRDLVDLLINVLRAYPVGLEVILDDGTRATVASHWGGSRWDRPLVRTPDHRAIDLNLQENGRFLTRVRHTARYLGADNLSDGPLEPSGLAVVAAPSELADLLAAGAVGAQGEPEAEAWVEPVSEDSDAPALSLDELLVLPEDAPPDASDTFEAFQLPDLTSSDDWVAPTPFEDAEIGGFNVPEPDVLGPRTLLDVNIQPRRPLASDLSLPATTDDLSADVSSWAAALDQLPDLPLTNEDTFDES